MTQEHVLPVESRTKDWERMIHHVVLDQQLSKLQGPCLLNDLISLVSCLK